MRRPFTFGLVLGFTASILPAQKPTAGRLSLSATVRGSFSVAVTSPSGTSSAASRNEEASITLGITESTRFVLRATGANLTAQHLIVRIKLNSVDQGWTANGVALSGGQEYTVDASFPFDADIPLKILNSNNLARPTSITLFLSGTAGN